MASEVAHGARAYRLTVAGAVLVLAVIVFANSWGVFTSDIKPEVYLAPQKMLGDYLSAWTFTPYLGGPSFNVGLAPVVGFLTALRAAGLSPEIAFKAFHLLLWGCAAGGMTRLARRLESRLTPMLGLVAGLAYIAHPYSVSAGATLAILLPMAVLPWQLLTLLHALERPRSWRWPALFGLTFFLMSGMNAGVVPVFGLLAVVPLTLYARNRWDLRWRAAAAVLAKCAAFVVGVSLYWLVPSVSAASTGATVVENSETMTSIADVSSFSEVLRGLGLWPLYGSDSTGPWQPGQVGYVTNTFMVLATFLAAALVVASLAFLRRPLARLAAGLIAVAVVIMVGQYPAGSPSPFGRLLGVVFDSVPALSAFRTTNKIGAVLVVGSALAVALAVAVVLRRLEQRPRRRGLVVAAVGALGVAVSLPAWTGNLYISEVDVPPYWRAAAAAIDNAPDQRRVLALPGQVQASYRWSDPRPDDVFNSLFRRDVIVPITTPSTSETAFNFGAALDDTFQSGVDTGSSTSTFARYLGADALLLRHDVNWEDNGGARPSLTQKVVAGDSGLTPVRNFGQPGENVASPVVPPDGFAETDVPPLQLYGVNGARSMVRTASPQGSVVVAGDGWSVPAMARRGLLADAPMFRYARDLDARQWQQALTTAGRLVLTDTNRRREAIANRLTNGQGPLLAASDELPATARTLGDDPDDQTVLRVEGGRASASQNGFAFFDIPWSTPDNAFDADAQTAWVFGDFGNGDGQQLRLRLDAKRSINTVRIKQSTGLGPVRIASMVVEGGGVRRQNDFDADGVAEVDLGGVRTDEVTFTVEGLSGEGFNALGVEDVTIDGVQLTRVARTPRTIDRQYEQSSGVGRSLLRSTPLDVLLTRVRGTASPADDEEANLERDFTLPNDRTFAVRGTVALDTDREDLYDRAAGLPASARSTSRIFDNPDVRASMAFDDDDETAWIPGEPLVGAVVEVNGSPRSLDTVTFDQRKIPGAERTTWAKRITVIADGVEVASADVDPGENTIDLTSDDGVAPSVGQLQVRVDEVDGTPGPDTSPPRIVEIGAGLTLEADEDDRCLVVGTLDDEPLRMRRSGTESSTTWEGCGRALSLEAGPHRFRSQDPGVTVDSLNLLDRRTSRSGTAGADTTTPEVTAQRGFGASISARTKANPGGDPYFLTIGQGYDPRWRASADGRDLGEPVVVDGYDTGWLITAEEAQDLQISYGPQRETNIAMIASGLTLLLIGLIVGVSRWGPGWRPALPWSLPRLRRWPEITRPGVPPVPPRARTVAIWLAVTAAAGVLCSWPGLVAMALFGLWQAVRAPGGRQLIVAGAGLVLLAGFLFVVGSADTRGTVTPALITDNPWPNVATVCGLVFAVLGVWRSGATPTTKEPARG